MSMSIQWLNKNKEIVDSLNNTACFSGINGCYNKEKHKYFCLLFPEFKEAKQNLAKQYIESLKELWNFREYMQDIDYPNHRIIFDLDVIPGHIIFAISTCIRYMEEYPSKIFVVWEELNNPEYFKLTTFEKFLFMHNLSGGNSNHAIYNYAKAGFDKVLTHKPDYHGGGCYGAGRTKPPKGYDLPFREFPYFMGKISLFQSYSPEGFVNASKSDGSFEKYLKAHCLNLNVLKRRDEWTENDD